MDPADMACIGTQGDEAEWLIPFFVSKKIEQIESHILPRQSKGGIIGSIETGEDGKYQAASQLVGSGLADFWEARSMGGNGSGKSRMVHFGTLRALGHVSSVRG
jgi:hypothetical protein